MAVMLLKPTDIFNLYIYDTTTSNWIEYTNGIIDVDIKRGAQEYKGPFTQSDVGQMIVRTRSMEVDPYQNPLVRYNNQIRITAKTVETIDGNITTTTRTIFTGFIEGINVEYKPKTEDSIVTITAIDIIGQLYKHVLSEDFIALQESWTTQELISAMNTEDEFNWLNGVLRYIVDRPQYAVGAIDSNTTAWDALTIRAKTDLGFLSARRNSNHLSYVSCDKDSPINPYNLDGYNLSLWESGESFKSDGTGASYKSIQISDGFERVVNDLTVKGFSTDVRSTNDNSVAIWRKTQANVNVSTNDAEDMQAIANEVLQEMSEPIREIFSLTFDGIKYPYMAGRADTENTVNIVHEINESLTIDRTYLVIGVNHKIDYETWDVTLQLKNVAYQDASIDNPIISVTPASGTTATDFTLSYTITNPSLIVSQSWDLDEGFTSTDLAPTVNYATGGTKTVTLTVLTIYGYTITSSIQLEVAGALPAGVINHSVSADNIYTFSWSGDPATTYYWQFGNGKSSNEANPTTYYETASGITVSLSVTNIYGTTTVTKNINVLASTNIPIRYIKFKVKNVFRCAEEIWTLTTPTQSPPYEPDENRFSPNSKYFPVMRKLDIVSASAGRINNAELVYFREYTVFVTTSKWLAPNYARSPRITEQDFLTNLLNPATDYTNINSGVSMYLMSYNYGSPTYGYDPAHVGLEFTIDLGQEYFDINEITLTHNNLGIGANMGRYEIEVSQDNVVFKDAGVIYDSTPTSWEPVTANGTWPVPRAAVTSTDDMTSYRKIRYAKVRFSDDAVGFENWKVAQLHPITGSYQFFTYTGGGTPSWAPPRNALTYLGPQLSDSNTGATVSLQVEGTSGGIVDRVTGTRIFAPTLTPRMNDGNYQGYTWQEQFGYGDGTLGGEKTFIYDMGEAKTNITGFAFTNIFSEYMFGNQSHVLPGGPLFKITIHTSEDGISWNALGTYDISPLAAGKTRVIITPDQSSTRGVGMIRPIRNTDSQSNMINFVA
jgi:PKD repeat protein